MSIAFTSTTFVSQNFGAGKITRIKSGIKSALILNLSIVGFLSLVLFAFAPFLTSIFIDDTDSIRYGSLFIRCTAPFYLLCAVCMLFSQVLRGLGDSLVPTIITFSGFVLLRQTFLFVATRLTPSFFVVAIAYPVVWIFTSLSMLVYFRIWMRVY